MNFRIDEVIDLLHERDGAMQPNPQEGLDMRPHNPDNEPTTEKTSLRSKVCRGASGRSWRVTA